MASPTLTGMKASRGAVAVQSRRRARAPLATSLIYIVLVICGVVALVPFAYMVLSSLKSYGSLINNNVWPWPPFGSESLQWVNYSSAIQEVGWDKQWGTWLFVRYVANSTIVAVATVVGVLVTSSLAAYAFAQIDVPGKNALFVVLLATI